MLPMRIMEDLGGDIEIAAPLLRVDSGASTALVFSAAPSAMAGDAAAAPVLLSVASVAHRRSNVIGLRYPRAECRRCPL
jgi:hypothetical protein